MWVFRLLIVFVGLHISFAYLLSDVLKVDHNGNGLFDEGETYVDINGNGIYDEGTNESYMDANGNGTWDQNEPFNDFNANGIYDGGIGGEYFVDVDGNGQWYPAEILIVDYDGDGEWDEGVYGNNPNTSYYEQTYELQPPDVYYDANNNGQYDIQEHYIDTNGNGEYDSYDPNLVSGEPFVDGNGTYDQGESFIDENPWNDIDNDGNKDVAEDIDEDGNLDVAEDINGNGILDPGEDLDGDGNLDVNEDVDGDGNLDVAELESLNGVYDLGETFVDSLNGVYDEWEEYTDLNGNNLYDSVILSDYFIDENSDGIFNQADVYIDSNDNGVFDDPQPAGIIYVNKASSQGGDGSSWATAFKYFSDALGAASDGSEIWVAKGLYYPDEGAGNVNGDTSSNFIINVDDLKILGGFNGDEDSPNQRLGLNSNITYLSGKIGSPSNWSDHILYIDFPNTSSVGRLLSLDNLTILGARVSALSGLYVSSDYHKVNAKNCIFRDNTTAGDEAGAVLSKGFDGLFIGCVFENNTSTGDSNSGNGKSSIFYKGSFTLHNCVFFNNQSIEWPTISRGGSFEIYNSLFVGNASLSNEVLFNHPSAMTISSSTFALNFGNGNSGCYLIRDSGEPVILTNTICNNNNNIYGFINGPIQNNSDLIVTPFTLYANNIAPRLSGDGWIQVPEALFIDASNPKGDDGIWFTVDDGLRLTSTGNAVGNGSLSYLSFDYEDLDYDGILLEEIPYDIMGLPRVNSGSLDLGAYAFIDTDNTDDDEDGLSTFDEINVYGSDPFNPDTSGDGFGDKLLVDFNLDPTVNYSALNSNSGFYSLNEIKDLRPGSVTIQVVGGEANINMDIESSTDLENWEIDSAITVPMPIEEGEATKFFRFKMAE